MKNILFVCTGNTCRSPMAEGIFNMLANSSGTEASALSCGTSAITGAYASPEAVEAAGELGADISKHSSRPVSAALVKEADLIFCMTPANLNLLTLRYPDSASKTAVLEPPVPDPFGLSLEVYRDTAQALLTACTAIIRRLKEENS